MNLVLRIYKRIKAFFEHDARVVHRQAHALHARIDDEVGKVHETVFSQLHAVEFELHAEISRLEGKVETLEAQLRHTLADHHESLIYLDMAKREGIGGIRGEKPSLLRN